MTDPEPPTDFETLKMKVPTGLREQLARLVSSHVRSVYGPGPALRAWLSIRGETMTEVAGRMGMSGGAMSQWCSGRVTPLRVTAELLEQECGFPQGWWL